MAKLISLFLLFLAQVSLAASDAVRKVLVEKGLVPEAASEIRATAFMIGGNDPTKGWSVRPSSMEEISLTEGQIRQILTTLNDRHTYVPDMVKACIPSYELGITFASVRGYTELLFCLTCDSLIIQDGTSSHRIDFDRGHNDFLRFFRKLYPRNKELKLLTFNDPKKVFTAEDVMAWAETCIPGDPLLLRVKAMKPEDQTDEILQELATKATATYRQLQKKTSETSCR
jgi:hypothetical protein